MEGWLGFHYGVADSVIYLPTYIFYLSNFLSYFDEGTIELILFAKRVLREEFHMSIVTLISKRIGHADEAKNAEIDFRESRHH